MAKQRSGLNSWPLVIILRYALAQGMHYMNGVERVHRLCLELTLMALIWGGFFRHWSVPLACGLSLVLAHGINLIVNGHIFALLKHDLFWFGFYKKWDDFSGYIEGIQRRLAERPCSGLQSAEIYGSLTRGKFGPDSDLDIRFIAKPGLWNAWVVCNRVWAERLYALATGFPLDIYMFRNPLETAKKMNLQKERPVIVYAAGDPSGSVPFRKQVPSPKQ